MELVMKLFQAFYYLIMMCCASIAAFIGVKKFIIDASEDRKKSVYTKHVGKYVDRTDGEVYFSLVFEIKNNTGVDVELQLSRDLPNKTSVYLRKPNPHNESDADWLRRTKEIKVYRPENQSALDEPKWLSPDGKYYIFTMISLGSTSEINCKESLDNLKRIQFHIRQAFTESTKELKFKTAKNLDQNLERLIQKFIAEDTEKKELIKKLNLKDNKLN